MSTPATFSLARELAAILGAEQVQDSPALSIAGVRPAVVVTPGSVEEVARVMKLASSRQLVVVPAGGMTRQEMGPAVARVDIVLSTTRMQSVLFYDPGDLTIGLEAGATVAQTQSVVGEHRLLLPLSSECVERATIGGVLATSAHGPLQHGYGGAREFCIGVQFVTADGKIAKAGGRVVKNVAGYDLMKLMIGSHGTLAVITGANFRLFPAPRQTRTFLAEFATLTEALAFRDFIVARSPLSPIALDVVSPLADRCVGNLPAGNRWRVLLRAGGSDAVLNRYQRELGSTAVAIMDGTGETKFWRAVSDFPATVAVQHPAALLLNVVVPMQSVQKVLEEAERVARENGFACAALGRATGALYVALLPAGAEPPAAQQYAPALVTLRGALPRDGSAVVVRCPADARPQINMWGATPNDFTTQQLIKRAFDPDDILNRGRFIF